MGQIKIAEKTKKKKLNGALLASLLLLASGFVRPSGFTHTNVPTDEQYSVYRLPSLKLSELPKYDEVALMSDTESEITSLANLATQSSSNLTKQAAPKQAGVTQTSAPSVQLPQVLPPVGAVNTILPTVNHTLDGVLQHTPTLLRDIKLF